MKTIERNWYIKSTFKKDEIRNEDRRKLRIKKYF